jgi:hypothetical protein
MVFVGYINIRGEKVHTIEKNIKALLFASKEIGLELNADKSTYTVKSLDQNARRSQYLQIDNSSYDRVDEFKYVGKT